MKSKLLIILLLLILFNCNKGTIFKSMYAKLSNDNKFWKLTKFTVNNIDSTDLINSANSSKFKDSFLHIVKESSTSGAPNYYNHNYILQVSIENHDKNFIVKGSWSFMGGVIDSNSCGTINPQDCQRNVFFPEGHETSWTIKRLRGGKFILVCKQVNEYYLEMTENNN